MAQKKCDYCTEVKNNITEISIENEVNYICRECYLDYITQCEICNEIIYKDDFSCQKCGISICKEDSYKYQNRWLEFDTVCE
ncbi:hypothetical protein, partial [Metaclostridioides mangenotii]